MMTTTTTPTTPTTPTTTTTTTTTRLAAFGDQFLVQQKKSEKREFRSITFQLTGSKCMKNGVQLKIPKSTVETRILC